MALILMFIASGEHNDATMSVGTSIKTSGRVRTIDSGKPRNIPEVA